MLTLWIVVIVIGALQIFETVLLVFLLLALGHLKQQGSLAGSRGQSPEEWGLAVGEKAPSFVATDYDGKVVRLDDFQGQRRILAFVSPGCSACDIALESLNAIKESERTYATLIIGGLDSENNRRYAMEHHSLVPILTPKRSLDTDVYRVRGFPFVFVLDKVGVIRAKGLVTQNGRLQELLAIAIASVSVS